MENSTFKAGKSYGNDLTIEIVKRTEKTATIKTQAWGEKRVKISSFVNAGGSITERISFKAWLIHASEAYSKETASYISQRNAYYN